jgi:ADP-ribosylglycohydrolase
LACGDAVGTAVEFSPPGTFEPVKNMTGGGPFGLEAGQWTDDTSLALCLAESLLERGGFDPIDQLQRYVRWWKEGHWSSTGKCFDIGITTRNALITFREGGGPYCGSTHKRSAGNGSIMRLAPVPMRFAREPAEAIHLAGESSRTTHGARVCIDACRYFAALIVGALAGIDKQSLLHRSQATAGWIWIDQRLCPEIREIAEGSFRRRSPPEIAGTGYVVKSLEAALWALDQTDIFESGCLLAVNLGDDADTTAAVYGQLAGAIYGESGLPPQWLDKLAMRREITSLADRLHAAATASSQRIS